jgi:hypothetical protein
LQWLEKAVPSPVARQQSKTDSKRDDTQALVVIR